MKKFYPLFLFFILITSASSQIIITKRIDILKGLTDSTIVATVQPATNEISRVFDGNEFVFLYLPSSDTLTITLHFLNPPVANKSKIYFFNEGYFTISTAENESDLNTKSGTYTILKSSTIQTNKWDSVLFSQRSLSFIRLQVKNTSANYIMFGEWAFETTVIPSAYAVIPYWDFAPRQARVVLDETIRMKVRIKDNQGEIYPLPPDEGINWSSSDTTVASVDQFGFVKGKKIGTAEISVIDDSRTLSGKTQINVIPDFSPKKAKTLNIKVALVLQNPILRNGQRTHEKFNWADPLMLSNTLIQRFREASDSVVNFQIVEIDDDSTLFTKCWDSYLTVDSLDIAYSTPGWTPLITAFHSGKLKFDYHRMIKYYKLDEKRNKGLIDEIWVYSHPYASMWESILGGPGAFYCNSSPLVETGFQKITAIMGLNFERGIDCAMESFGHRSESIMFYVFGRWNCRHPDRNAWEAFTTIHKDVPNEAHIGNIHYPCNGKSDYDFGNRDSVPSYADNWQRYPDLFCKVRKMNYLEWLKPEGSHEGYMRWWYSHLPRFEGITGNILNNWWHYIVAYDSAIALAKTLTISDRFNPDVPANFGLEQNYPNPFNSTTTFRFSLFKNRHVKMQLFDLLGREIDTLCNQEFSVGSHALQWNAKGISSGVYFYRLSASGYSHTKKLLLLR